jgi:hypothetical protein
VIPSIESQIEITVFDPYSSKIPMELKSAVHVSTQTLKPAIPGLPSMKLAIIFPTIKLASKMEKFKATVERHFKLVRKLITATVSLSAIAVAFWPLNYPSERKGGDYIWETTDNIWLGWHCIVIVLALLKFY